MLTYSGVTAREEPGSDHDLLTRGWATATLLSAGYDDPGETELPRFDGQGDASVPVDISAGTVMSSGADRPAGEIAAEERSEERRVGKGWSARWGAGHTHDMQR